MHLPAPGRGALSAQSRNRLPQAERPGGHHGFKRTQGRSPVPVYAFPCRGLRCFEHDQTAMVEIGPHVFPLPHPETLSRGKRRRGFMPSPDSPETRRRCHERRSLYFRFRGAMGWVLGRNGRTRGLGGEPPLPRAFSILGRSSRAFLSSIRGTDGSFFKGEHFRGDPRGRLQDREAEHGTGSLPQPHAQIDHGNESEVF